MKDRLTELAYAAGWRAVRAMPRPAAQTLFRRGADLAVRRDGRGVQRLRRNLGRVVGAEPGPDLMHAAMRSYARYWLEMFRLPSRSREQILTDFRVYGEELLAEDVATGRGAVVALPHGGNWDAAGAWVAAKGWPITTVAERLKPESLYDRFLAFRVGLGMEIIPLTGGQRPPIEILGERVRAGAIVPLLADRDLSSRGVPVEFFGGRTRMPPGPALLALRTGAPLYTADMWFDGAIGCARLRGPVRLPGPDEGTLDQRVHALTQQLADLLAAGIAEHPEDWHMLQRMWLDEPATPAAQVRPETPEAPEASTGLRP